MRNVTFVVCMAAFTTLLVVASLSGQSAGDTPVSAGRQRVVVHLTHFTDDLHRCFMALKMANLMQEYGADVKIFLDLEGVRLAERRQTLNMTWGPNPQTLAELYEQFIDGQGQVVLCPHCAKSARIGDLGLKRNANIGSLEDLARMLLQADKVMDY